MFPFILLVDRYYLDFPKPIGASSQVFAHEPRRNNRPPGWDYLGRCIEGYLLTHAQDHLLPRWPGS
nr:hypothetical protein [Desulfovirgula thermocuniculi]